MKVMANRLLPHVQAEIDGKTKTVHNVCAHCHTRELVDIADLTVPGHSLPFMEAHKDCKEQEILVTVIDNIVPDGFIDSLASGRHGLWPVKMVSVDEVRKLMR